jgi:hypothetical protein
MSFGNLKWTVRRSHSRKHRRNSRFVGQSGRWVLRPGMQLGVRQLETRRRWFLRTMRCSINPVCSVVLADCSAGVGCRAQPVNSSPPSLAREELESYFYRDAGRHDGGSNSSSRRERLLLIMFVVFRPDLTRPERAASAAGTERSRLEFGAGRRQQSAMVKPARPLCQTNGLPEGSRQCLVLPLLPAPPVCPQACELV